MSVGDAEVAFGTKPEIPRAHVLRRQSQDAFFLTSTDSRTCSTPGAEISLGRISVASPRCRASLSPLPDRYSLVCSCLSGPT